MNLRPKTFGAKLLLLFVIVVAAAQLTTGIIVARANRAQARAGIDEQLARAARAFAQIVQDRNGLLVASATNAARDYQIKQLFVSEDTATLTSALPSLQLTSKADIVSALSLDGRTLASTMRARPAGDVLAQLIARAETDPSPFPTATGYAYIEDAFYSLAVAPMRAPDIIGWMAIGFRIDHAFAQALEAQTGVAVTFLNDTGHLLATTLPAATASALMSALSALPQLDELRSAAELPLAGETALLTVRRLPAGTNHFATLLLQYSLDEKLRPARRSERLLLWVTLGSIALAIVISRGFAQRLAQPIVALVGHTRRIAAGDYATRIGSDRDDELGRLAHAFDQMSDGLAERDRVRDLLDKNVSPEVAAQLLRDGAALGGEEREVTILFADLRGFTTLSEQLAPRDLLALLNRYLDRMSAAIERQGGVIDKFIGDAIMALFGAPLAQDDAADRALAAALAMERALADLNRELAAEGRPPLALGIGINTARVVAGNIGSHRRLNYSVIGDGVNVAARLQSLTRTPDYATSVITSAATLAALRAPEKISPRPLGPVHVKGRVEPVEIFAVG